MSHAHTQNNHTDAAAEQQVLAEAADRLEHAEPIDILDWAVERYRPGITLACSFGMQSVAVIDMLDRLGRLADVEIFYTDTGVLFGETHQTRLRIQERYGFVAVRVAADLTWEQQQQKFGGHLYERGPDGVNQCCHIRKVEPTRRYLLGKTAWITGMRRSHSKTRAQVGVVMWDARHGLAKINPLALKDDPWVWDYIKRNDVPYNPLYNQGYPSIGCNTPVCTRQVAEGDDARSGRWAGLGKTECGLHLDGNAIKSLDSSHL